MVKPYYRQPAHDSSGRRVMLPLYDLWIKCANEALAEGRLFTRIVWGR